MGDEFTQAPALFGFFLRVMMDACGSNNTKRWTSLTGAVNNVAQIPSVNGFFVKAVAGAASKKTQMWYYPDHKAHDW
jgi:hypothetical protein